MTEMYLVILHKLLTFERVERSPGVELASQHQPPATQHNPRSNKGYSFSCNAIIDLPRLYHSLQRRRYLSKKQNKDYPAVADPSPCYSAMARYPD
jgi:hypothetical protein